MDVYHYLRARIKEVTYSDAISNTVRKEIEDAYRDNRISGTDYDNLMTLLDEWIWEEVMNVPRRIKYPESFVEAINKYIDDQYSDDITIPFAAKMADYAIKALPDYQRTLITERYVKGYSLDKIGARHGIATSTVGHEIRQVLDGLAFKWTLTCHASGTSLMFVPGIPPRALYALLRADFKTVNDVEGMTITELMCVDRIGKQLACKTLAAIKNCGGSKYIIP